MRGEFSDRSCGGLACSPRWNPGDYGACNLNSKTKGMLPREKNRLFLRNMIKWRVHMPVLPADNPTIHLLSSVWMNDMGNFTNS